MDTCVDSCSGNKLNCDNCKAGYLKVGNICEKCTSPCKTCSSSLGNCESCETGHYLSGSLCNVCPHPFLECTDSSTAVVCKTGLGRQDKD